MFKRYLSNPALSNGVSKTNDKQQDAAFFHFCKSLNFKETCLQLNPTPRFVNLNYMLITALTVSKFTPSFFLHNGIVLVFSLQIKGQMVWSAKYSSYIFSRIKKPQAQIIYLISVRTFNLGRKCVNGTIITAVRKISHYRDPWRSYWPLGTTRIPLSDRRYKYSTPHRVEQKKY